MACCGGRAGGDIRGRRVYYVVYNSAGKEVAETLDFEEALQIKRDTGGGASMKVRKRFPN